MSCDIDIYNVNELCRLCLSGDGTILPIFGLEHSSIDCIPLSYKIKACVSVEINKNDILPKKICVSCVHQVDSWHKFKSVCDTSQSKLQSWYKSQFPDADENSRSSQPYEMQHTSELRRLLYTCARNVWQAETFIQFDNADKPYDWSKHVEQQSSLIMKTIVVFNLCDKASLILKVQGEVKQEYEDNIDDDDVVCCNDVPGASLHSTLIAPLPVDVILVEDDDDADDNCNGDFHHNEDDSEKENDMEVEDGFGNEKSGDKTRNSGEVIGNKSSSSKKSPITNGDFDSVGSSKNKQVESTNKNLVNGIERNKNNNSFDDSWFDGDELMLADFRNEVAPDVELSQEDVDKVKEKEIIVENECVNNDCTDKEATPSPSGDGDVSIKLLKDKSSNIIDRISSEINRRLSSDDNPDSITANCTIANGRNASESDDRGDVDSISNNDVDDIVEEDDEIDEQTVVEKRELRPRTNRNYRTDSLSSSPTLPDPGLVIVEGFSLSDYNSEANNDIHNLHHRFVRQPGPDLEMLDNVNSNHSSMMEVFHVKQEPLSPPSLLNSTVDAPVGLDPLDLNAGSTTPGTNTSTTTTTIKKEVDDWTLMTPEPIDIKPDISLLNTIGMIDNNIETPGKRRKYPQFKNGIPCEPCKSAFPNYVKWLRHTKSHKHQRNVALFDINRRPFAPGVIDPVQMLQQQSNYLPPRPPRQPIDCRLSPCPIGGCQAMFKHRRNLVTHVRTHHGYRLKDLEAKAALSKQLSSEKQSVTTSNNNADQVGGNDGANDDEDDGGNNDNGEKNIFKCSHCPKTFDLRISLKSHLLIKHRIASISAKLQCERCFKKFHRKTGLLSHLRSCGKYMKSRKCPYCLIVLPTYKETVYHKSRCTKRFTPSSNVQSINNSSGGGGGDGTVGNSNFSMAPNEDGTYSCEFCNITFEIQSAFYNHMELYHAGHLESLQKNDAGGDGEENKESSEKDPDSSIGLTTSEQQQQLSADQDADGRFACRYCVKTFADVEELQDHISYHDINKIFQCKLCFVTLNCKRYFQDHMRSHFIQHRGQYLCWTCFKPFDNRRDLTAHKTLHIQLKIYSCNVCDLSFNSILTLERHKKTHSQTTPDKSTENDNVEDTNDVDKQNTIETSSDDRGMRIKDEISVDFICQVCKKGFSSETALEKHSKLHNPVNMEVIKRFVQVCDHCKNVFKTTSAFRDHLQYCKHSTNAGGGGGGVNDSYLNDKYKKIGARIQCDKCFTTFATKMSLGKHKKMNRCPLYRKTNEMVQFGATRLYHCKYCRKRCTNLLGLSRHLKGCSVMQMKRRAAGVDANHCIKCRKQFSSLSVLFNHEKYCTAQNDHVGQPLSQNQGDAEQFVSVTSVEGTGGTKCLNCNSEWGSAESLARHQKFCKTFGGIATEENVATGERYFSACNNCNKKFTTELSYKLHKKFCSSGTTISSAPGTGAARCKGCARVFVTRDRLRVHEKMCKLSNRQSSVVIIPKPQEVHQCLCGSVFSSSGQLDLHKETCQHLQSTGSSLIVSSSTKTNSTPAKILSCEYCFKKFTKYQAKNSHMRVCQVKLRVNPKRKKYSYQSSAPPATISVPPPSTMPFSCLICKGTFDTELELIDHSCHEYAMANDMEVNNITVEPDIPQEILDMQSSTQQYHHQQFTPRGLLKPQKRIFKCLPCNKIFSGSSALNKHSQLFHGQSRLTSNALINRDGTVQCPRCPRSFRDHKSLTHHMGWHTRQSGLPTTSSMPDETGPPTPSSSSSSSFLSPEVIITTTSSSDNSSQFSCSICFRKFLGKGPLQNHMRTHSNILSGNANPAVDSSDINEDITPNVKRARGGNAYRCKICPKVFRDKLSLINHHNLHKTVSPANSLKAKLLSRAGKTYVSCNICHKILSSNSIPKHNKLHKLRQDKMPTSFPPVSLTPIFQSAKQNKPSAPPAALFPCGFCYKLFHHQRSLTEHIIMAHSNNKTNRTSVSDKHQEKYEDDDDDVYIVDDDDDDNNDNNEQYNMTIEPDQPIDLQDDEDNADDAADDDEQDGQDNVYKCEICDKSWKHRSMYLRHVNAQSHKELTKRLSDILTRVNHDINIS